MNNHAHFLKYIWLILFEIIGETVQQMTAKTAIHSSLSIHSLTSTCLGSGHGVNNREPLFPASTSSSSRGIPKCCQASGELKSPLHVLGLPCGLLLIRHAQNTSPGRCSGGILTRNTLNDYLGGGGEQQLYPILKGEYLTPFSDWEP